MDHGVYTTYINAGRRCSKAIYAAVHVIESKGRRQGTKLFSSRRNWDSPSPLPR